MKKLVLVFTLILLFAGSASAITSDIGDSYSSKETIIGKLSGNILSPISKEQVNLVRDGHIDVAFDYDFRMLEKEYYIWLIAPANPGNYTLVIENIYTTVDGVPQILDYEKDFAVKGNATDYSIKPGFVFATSNFEITATLYEDFDKTISIDFPDSREIALNPGTNKIDFSISEVVGTEFITISIGKYGVPAYIIGSELPVNENDTDGNQTDDEINGTNQTDGNVSYIGEIDFGFKPGVIRSVALVGEKTLVYPFEIVNFGDSLIENIVFIYDLERFEIHPDENVSLNVNESARFNLVLRNVTGEEKGGIVTARAGNETRHFVLILNFTTNETGVSTDYFDQDRDETPLYYCSELGGKFCSGEEICSGEVVASLDGSNCCSTGQCEAESEGSKAWIGYLLVAIVILVLLVIYVKYKKKGPSKTPLKSRVAEVEKKLP